MIIDAFAHCSPETYLPIEALEEASARAGIDGTLLVQHMGEFDNRYLASVAAEAPERYKAVCMVEPRLDGAAERLEGLLGGGALGARFVGARLSRAMIDHGAACLEVLDEYGGTIVLHLPDGIACNIGWIENLARKYPRIVIYIPHLGWPVVEGRVSPGWHDAVRRLADWEQMVFGISAVHHFSATAFPHEDIWSYPRHLLATVGADRAVWASDFPLLLEAETVEEYLGLFWGENLGLTPRERDAVLGSTAARLWGFHEQIAPCTQNASTTILLEESRGDSQNHRTIEEPSP